MKQYKVSQHAIDRAVERLGFPLEHAKNNLVSLMQTASYVGDAPGKQGVGKVYDHYKSRTRMIISQDGTIITAYKMPTLLETLPAEIVGTIKRKIDGLIRKYNTEARAIERKRAEKNLEIAQLQLNRANARSPKVVAAIDVKIVAAKAEYRAISNEADAVNKKIAEVQAHV
jgi:hypothetical protein